MTEKPTDELILDQLRYLTPKIERAEESLAKLQMAHEKLKWKVMALSAAVTYLAHTGIQVAKAWGKF